MARRQIRADLFDDGVRVTAYLSHPTGLNPTNIEDRYVSELREYAASQGFADRFSFIYADCESERPIEGVLETGHEQHDVGRAKTIVFETRQ